MDFINDNQWLWVLIGLLSVFTFLGSIFIIPWLILQIPEDYFAGDHPRRMPWEDRHPLIQAVLILLKNVLGCFLIVFGFALLVLPGQGLLTMFLGVLLLDFPGRFRLKRWLAQRPVILRSINWLRSRYDRPPLRFSPNPG